MPAPGVPILTDPVILPLPAEVGRKAAAYARRHASGDAACRKHQRIIATRADRSPVRRPLYSRIAAIKIGDLLQPAGQRQCLARYRPELRLARPRRPRASLNGWSTPCAMRQKAPDIRRQPIEVQRLRCRAPTLGRGAASVQGFPWSSSDHGSRSIAEASGERL